MQGVVDMCGSRDLIEVVAVRRARADRSAKQKVRVRAQQKADRRWVSVLLSGCTKRGSSSEGIRGFLSRDRNACHGGRSPGH